MTKKLVIELLLFSLILLVPGVSVFAQTPIPTPTATASAVPTEEVPTEEPPTSDRPVVMIDSYTTSTTPARGQDFSMSMLFHNSGKRPAYNIFIEFVSGELIPRNNGGMQTIYQLIMNETKGLSQGFTVSADLWGAVLATVTVNLEYSDDLGNTYSDSFAIAIDLEPPVYGAPTATPTPSPVFQPQLVIDSFETDVEILQPGSAFDLSLSVINLGNARAQAISMVLGGGSVEVNPEGTLQPGISGEGGEFATFSPLESSNVQYLGDLGPEESLETSQKIIVNVDTAPGAYSLKYSFIYTTEDEERVVDNQVITLLIYRMPSLEIGFYQDPGPLFVGQPNNLPLQIMNLGKQNVVLGNMLVAAENATLENNTALVGPVEAGFYFTLDTMIIPNEPGSLELLVSVNYTDDFNQARVYETALTLEVMESDMLPGGMPGEGEFPPGEGIPSGGSMGDPTGGDPFADGEETFWQKVVRFFKGLFGLGSGRQEDGPPTGPFEEMPPGEMPPEEMLPPVEVP